MNDLPVPDFDADERNLVARQRLERYGRIAGFQDTDLDRIAGSKSS